MTSLSKVYLIAALLNQALIVTNKNDSTLKVAQTWTRVSTWTAFLNNNHGVRSTYPQQGRQYSPCPSDWSVRQDTKCHCCLRMQSRRHSAHTQKETHDRGCGNTRSEKKEQQFTSTASEATQCKGGVDDTVLLSSTQRSDGLEDHGKHQLEGRNPSPKP